MVKSKFLTLIGVSLLCSSVLMAQDEEKRTWELSAQLASGKSDFEYSGSDFGDFLFDGFYKPEQEFSQLSFKLSTPIYKSFSAYGGFRFNSYNSKALPKTDGLIAQANDLGLLDVLNTLEPLSINPDTTVLDLNSVENNNYSALSLGIQYDYTINKLRFAPYAGFQFARMTNSQLSLDLETELVIDLGIATVTSFMTQDDFVEMKSESAYAVGYEFGLFADYEVHAKWRVGLGYDYSKTKFNFDNEAGLNLDAIQNIIKSFPDGFVDPTISETLFLAQGQTLDMSHNLSLSQSRIYLNVAYTF